MSLEVTFLGGAAAWPNPGQGCSSFLVRSGDETILVDCGSNTLLELRKHIDFREVGAIVLSHCHSDHILDLVPYRYGLVYGPGESDRAIPLYLPPGGIGTLDALADALGGQGERNEAFWDGAFKRSEYDPHSSLTLGTVSVQFARTDHPAECYAMRLSTGDGVVLVYSADTGSIDSVTDLAQNCDVLIAEATMPDGSDKSGGEVGHLSPTEAGRLADQTKAGTLVLTHLWAERPDEDVVRGASAHYHGPILVAKPGLVVNAGS